MRRFCCALPEMGVSANNTYSLNWLLKNQRFVQTACAVYAAERKGNRQMTELFEKRTGHRWDSRYMAHIVYRLKDLYCYSTPLDENRSVKARMWLVRKGFSPVCVEAFDLFEVAAHA